MLLEPMPCTVMHPTSLPMLEQLFLGLRGNDIIVHANEANAALGECSHLYESTFRIVQAILLCESAERCELGPLISEKLEIL